MTLNQVFQVLHSAGYIEEQLSAREAPNIWNGVYKFRTHCFRPTYLDVLQQNNINPCRAEGGGYGLKFHRKDINGIEYYIQIRFTEFATPTRADALANARVVSLSGSISLKERVGQAYYEKLASEKYGADLNFERRVYGHQFDSNQESSDEININPTAVSLSVKFHWGTYNSEQRDILYNKMIESSKANSRSVTLPLPFNPG